METTLYIKTYSRIYILFGLWQLRQYFSYIPVYLRLQPAAVFQLTLNMTSKR